MNNFERLGKAISFIESNLKEKINLSQIASEACFSKYHFHRIFNALAGETVGDYIRKRRLTAAARDLLFTEKKILEIALEYQFESQATFTRAFKNLFCSTPGNYRKEGKNLVLYARRPLELEEIKRLHRGSTMEPKLKEIDGFSVIGIEKTVTINTNYLIYQMWMDFLPRTDEIKNRSNNSYIEVSKALEKNDIENFTADSEFIEVVSVPVDKVEDIPNGMISLNVPGGRYMVFTHKGKAMELPDTYNYIWGKWVPNSDYKIRLEHTFELYDERFLGPENSDSEVDVYIPII